MTHTCTCAGTYLAIKVKDGALDMLAAVQREGKVASRGRQLAHALPQPLLRKIIGQAKERNVALLLTQ